MKLTTAEFCTRIARIYKNMVESKERKAIKAGVWYTIVNFLTKGAIYFTTPIFTRIMSQSDIGLYSNINAWYQVLIYVLTFDMAVSLGVARFDYKEELDKYSASILVYGSGITLLFYIIVAFNMEFFCSFLSMPAYVIHIIFLYILVNPAFSVYQARKMFLFQYKASAAVTVLTLGLSIGFSLLLVHTMEDQLMGRVIGNFVPVTLVCFCIYVFTIIRGRGISLKYLKYALVISFPMIWHSIAIHLLASGDRIVITKLLGSEANGLYTVAFTTGTIASALWNAMNSAWSPWSTEKMNSGDTETMKKASRVYLLLFAFVVLWLLLLTPEILLLMGGREYSEAVFVLPPVIVGCLCQFVYSFYVNAEFYLKKQTRIAVATMIAAVLNLGLNYLLIPRFGYIVAAYTTLFGYLFLLLFHTASLLFLGKGRWYDNRFNYLIVTMFLVMVPITNLLYKHAVIRYSVILLMFAATMYLIIRFWEVIREFVETHLGIKINFPRKFCL